MKFAIEKANVQLQMDGTPDEGWPAAMKKIEDTMEKDINEYFATFKFRQNAQDQQSMDTWYKRLRAAVKTLRLQKCTCGLGYSEDRAIRDIMVELTTDSKLRKDGLSKDLSLTDLLKEGEANELARRRAKEVEGKSIARVMNNDEGDLTEAQAEIMIAKLKKAGKYSTRSDRQKDGKESCQRCTNPKKQHAPDKCYFRDQECRACKQTGHMAGSVLCSKTEVKKVKKVSIEKDYDDPSNWSNSGALEQWSFGV